jgi:hypothetical protein
VVKGTTKTLALDVSSPASPVIFGSGRIEPEMPYLTILWVCQYGDIADRVPVHSYDTLRFDRFAGRRVVADRRQPPAFALKEFDAAHESIDRLREPDGQDCLFEQGRHSEPSVVQLDRLPLVPTDGNHRPGDSDALWIALILCNQRFRYHARYLWVIF